MIGPRLRPRLRKTCLPDAEAIGHLCAGWLSLLSHTPLPVLPHTLSLASQGLSWETEQEPWSHQAPEHQTEANIFSPEYLLALFIQGQ